MALLYLALPEQLCSTYPQRTSQTDISRQLAKLQLMCGSTTGLKSVGLAFADEQKRMSEEIRYGVCGPTGAQGPQGAQGHQANYVGLSAGSQSINKAKYYGVKS